MLNTKKAMLALADGFEEIEAIGTIDILRRAEIKVITVSVGGYTVTSARGIKIMPDMLIENCCDCEFDAIILPGGSGGSEILAESEILINMLKKQIQRKAYIAAICAAPALVLAGNHLLGNAKATCYPIPEFIDMIENYTDEKVVVSDGFVTSQGIGTVFDFSLKLVELLVSADKANELAADMLI